VAISKELQSDYGVRPSRDVPGRVPKGLHVTGEVQSAVTVGSTSGSSDGMTWGAGELASQVGD